MIWPGTPGIISRSVWPSVSPSRMPLWRSKAGFTSRKRKSTMRPLSSRSASLRKKASCMPSNMARQRWPLARSAVSVRWRSMASAALRVTSAMASISSADGERTAL
ncbi:hypothetical protein G6F31_019448 [Rhizopus arrhizus]|nr:hypothetical protein G6F31_019448 [Rhizopus arrhizus]